MKKVTFVFTAGAIGLFIDSGRIVKYVVDGVRLENNLWFALALAMPASFLGAYVGRKLTDKIPEKKFRLVIAVALLLMAVIYIVQPFN